MIEVKVKNISFSKRFVIIAGPCSIESEKQLFETAKAIKPYIHILRGGAYKPRTHPDSFQGLGEKGLKILKRVSEKLGLLTVTEVLDPRDVDLVAEHSDMLQIGARNMQNFPLLREVGKRNKPVLLKRGFGNTIEEWLAATEYIRREGNNQIVLCERGIRTFENSLRFTLDLAGALFAQRKSEYPVIIDPSHATGRPDLIEPLAKAAKAAGINGIMVEVHCCPEKALSDRDQALTPEEFRKLAQKLQSLKN